MDDQRPDREGGIRYRKLRIAWSVLCGIACLLLIVLWVRSYTIRDSAFWPRTKLGIEINSMQGHVVLFIAFQPFTGGEQFKIRHEKITPNDEMRVKRGILGFFYYPQPQAISIHIHFWFLTLSAAAAAIALWVQWSRQFTLRSLLLATALIAVVLGLAVWFSRK
jgi:hypothetical protein